VWQALLGAAFNGILGSDRLSAYNSHPSERRQLCWAHLKRNIRGIADRGDAAGEWGCEMLAWVQKLFALWHAYQEGVISQETWDVALDYVKYGVWEQLEAGRQVALPKAQSLSQELMRLWDGLWVFVTVEGVDPTNNAAEQALRPAVLWRKGSFGTQSEAGSRFVERILTVRETCRRQGRSLRVFVMEAVAAHRAKRPAPTLVSPP
jgi:transposase